MKVSLADLSELDHPLLPQIEAKIKSISNSTRYINGPEVKQFEENIAKIHNVKYGVSCASGSDALHMALSAAGIGKGDEVIVTSYSMFASSSFIDTVGAKPVFVDIKKDTFNIDEKRIYDAITEKTKAIIVVHLFGQCANMQKICSIANQANLVVIEDACQAVLAKYNNEYVGRYSDIACLSFFPTKNLGCWGDGGALITNNKEYAEKSRLFKGHGATKKYHHSIIGINSRLDEIQAAILNIKLKVIKSQIKKRQKNAKLYDELLWELTTNNNIRLPKIEKKSEHTYHQYVIICERRDELKEYLAKHDIGSEIYYPIPLHLQECYKNLKYKEGDLKVSEKACAMVLALPIHPTLTRAQINFVCNKIKEFYRGK